MMILRNATSILPGATLLLAGLFAPPAALRADENMFGYVKGAESLPKGAQEWIVGTTHRRDKGTGEYQAWNSFMEFEKGFTDRFTAAVELKAQAIDTSGLLVNGYLPGDEEYGPKISGSELSLKYNFLAPAKDWVGLGLYFGLNYDWLDPHSGQDKNTLSFETELLLQKYLLDGEMIWLGNLGVESTYADRKEISGLPEDFEWPTEPEMELEAKLGSGLSYRLAPNWYVGGEALYETEFETEVGQERWSVFAGPSIHYGSAVWWATLTWFEQIEGGGEQYDGQSDTSLHLIEKTEREFRLKVGFNL